MADTVSIRYSQTFRPQPARWVSQSQQHIVFCAAFEDLEPIAPLADLVFLVPPAVPIDCSQHEYREWIEFQLGNLQQHCAPSCGLILCAQERKGHPYSKAVITAVVAQELGWELFRIFTWQRQEAPYNRSNYAALPVYAMRRGSKPAQRNSPIRFRDIVYVKDMFGAHEELVDPVPPEVPETFLSLFAVPSDTALDPFAGTGSTALACEILGLKSVSVELNPERARKIAQLLSAAEKIRGIK